MRRVSSLFLLLLIAGGWAAPARGQAFTAPKGLWALSIGYQYVDNTGHRLSDGYMLREGQSVSSVVLVDGEYAATDRLAVSLGLPLVFVKYTGATPPPVVLPVDTCHCWHSGFADLSGSVRYRLGGDTFAFTPAVAFGLPSHAYPYQGEAVIGRRLKEVRFGAGVGVRPRFLPRSLVSAAYSYAIVEKAELDIPDNRSNAGFQLGYGLNRRLFVQAVANWQRTHGGLRFGSVPPADLLFPGEVDTRERLAEHDRLLRDNHWRVGGGLTYSLRRADVFASVSAYVSGTDTHDGQAFTFGATFYLGPSAH